MKKFLKIGTLGLIQIVMPVLVYAQSVDFLFDEEDFESSLSQFSETQTQPLSKQKLIESDTLPSSNQEDSLSSFSLAPTPTAPQKKPITLSIDSPIKTPVKEKEKEEAEEKEKETAEEPLFPNDLKEGGLSGQTPSLPKLGSGGSANKTPAAPKKEEENLSIFEKRRRKVGLKETDVSKFDIAGLMLGMTPEQTKEIALANGFTLKTANAKIPEFLRWRYKDECLKQKVSVYTQLQKCIKDAALQNQKQYVDKQVFEKKANNEKITLSFTSPFANNSAFRIRYDNFGNASWGSTTEANYLKRKRRQDFFRDTFQKYGQPDDPELLIWGGGDTNSASFVADITPTFLDASLVLEDLSLTDNDIEAMQSNDAQAPSMNTFAF